MTATDIGSEVSDLSYLTQFNHMAGVTHEVVYLSSEQAAEWLEAYRGPNRRVSEGQVLKYQSDMEAGRWHFQGSPLVISTTHKMLDGQHRLIALANCVPSVTLPFLVVRGVPDSHQLVIDLHSSRTVAQQLSLRGLTHSSVYAASAKLYLEWTRGRLFKSSARGSTSKTEIVQWVLDHQDLLEAIAATKFQQVDAPPSAVGAFALAVIQANPTRAVEFFDRLASAVGWEDGDPLLALDRRLRNIRKAGIRLHAREWLALFIKAWNAWVLGDRLSKLQLGSIAEDNFPELYAVSESARV